MNTKYTPGPWVVGINQMVFVEGDQSRRIADVRGWGWLQYLPNGAEQQDANAHLIAAAPDLLDAVRGALAALSQNATLPKDIDAAKIWLKAAIKKATGGGT